MAPLPISVLIVTRNEEARLPRCLRALDGAFGEVVVIDSESADATAEIARRHGARAVSFRWNGAYPKKRQWCLENVPLRHDWIFFLDADEELTPGFIEALSRIGWENTPAAGYFVTARYVVNDRVLRGGLRNNKLCLLHRGRMEFPRVEDASLPGMGEIEGHYQPVRKAGCEHAPIGQIAESILHHAFDDPQTWEERHARYAVWEAEMDARALWPADPVPARRVLKALFKALPFRAEAAFLHSYILKAGFIDGAAGFALAASRYRYYRAIRALAKR